jgi:hypothetical protein
MTAGGELVRRLLRVILAGEDQIAAAVCTDRQGGRAIDSQIKICASTLAGYSFKRHESLSEYL